MGSFIQDIRYGIRMLLRSPGATAVAVLSLALGIGATSTIFSIVDGIFLRSWPVAAPEELVLITTLTEGRSSSGTSWQDFLDLQEQNSVFSGILAFGRRGGILSHQGRGETVITAVVSENFFDLLGVRPAQGHTFEQHDLTSGKDPGVVLSHGIWQRRFGGDPGLLGSTVSLSGKHLTVLGVAPPEFRGLDPMVATGVWVTPAGWGVMTGDRIESQRRDNRWLQIIGRLGREVDFQEAKIQLDTIAARLAESFPDTNGKSTFYAVLESHRRRENLGVTIFIMSMGGLVLLISCANVANLQLAQTDRRRGEMAMRAALGAKGGRVIRQLLTESTLLAILGGVFGLLLAAQLIRLIPDLMPPAQAPIGPDIRLDRRVLLFTGCCAVLTALAFGIIPALRAARTDLVAAIKGAAGTGRGGTGVMTTRGILVAAEIALALVLITSAGLLLRSLWLSQRIHPGFDAKKSMLLLRIAPAVLYGYSPAQSENLFETLAERIRAVPGVLSVSYARRPPLAGYEGGERRTVVIPGYTPASGDEGVRIRFNTIALGYFETMGTRILQGRDFDRRDGPGSTRAVIINETMANQFWPGASAVDQWVRIQDREVLIIGVVEDGTYVDIHEDRQPYFFFPFAQNFSAAASFFIETSGDQQVVLGAVLSEARSLDEKVPVTEVVTLARHMQSALYEDRTAAMLIGGLGILGILLAAAGLYGVVSYMVNRRTRELGVRMALGARPRDVLTMILAHVLKLILVGLGVGIPTSLAVSRLMRGYLFGVAPTDPAAYIGSSLLVAAVAMLAAAHPSLRAAGIEPTRVLRHE
jgi:predicted permease